jgi:hypothetical protein
VKALKMRIRPGLLGLLAAIAVSGAASAQPCTTAALSVYLTVASCTVGDKTFSDFSFANNIGGSGVALTSNDITVAPEMTMDGPGLLFSSDAITVTQETAITSPTFIDVSLDYTVTAGSGFQIDDAGLVIAGEISGNGEGSVTEFLTASPSGMSLPMLGAVLPATSDTVIFTTSVDDVDVLDDILVELPPGDTGSANISDISQQFSQISVVPEPTTFAMLVMGLLGLSIARLRTRTRPAAQRSRFRADGALSRRADRLIRTLRPSAERRK